MGHPRLRGMGGRTPWRTSSGRASHSRLRGMEAFSTANLSGRVGGIRCSWRVVEDRVGERDFGVHRDQLGGAPEGLVIVYAGPSLSLGGAVALGTMPEALWCSEEASRRRKEIPLLSQGWLKAVDMSMRHLRWRGAGPRWSSSTGGRWGHSRWRGKRTLLPGAAASREAHPRFRREQWSACDPLPLSEWIRARYARTGTRSHPCLRGVDQGVAEGVLAVNGVIPAVAEALGVVWTAHEAAEPPLARWLNTRLLTIYQRGMGSRRFDRKPFLAGGGVLGSRPRAPAVAG